MGCQLHTLCEVLKRTDFLLVELAQNQLLTGCCARVSSVFYYVWLTKGQKGGFLLTLIERGSWMLLKSGGGLNQPAPSRSPQNNVKNKTKKFLIF